MKINRLNKKNASDIGANDVCNIMNEFMTLNTLSKHHYDFKQTASDCLSLNQFHNPQLTAPIHLLCYVLDTELDDNIMYTGITENGITFNKSAGKKWKDVYSALVGIL